MRQIRVAILALILSFTATSSYGGVLGVGNVTLPSAGVADTGHAAAMILDIGSAGIFLGMFDVATPDSFFRLDLTDPSFIFLTDALTNGFDDLIGYSTRSFFFGASGGVGMNESALFLGSPGLINGFDFTGGAIDHIDFFVKNLVSSPGVDPNGDGIWTDYSAEVRIVVYDTVPEPAILMLFIPALLLILRVHLLARNSIFFSRHV